MHRGSSSTDHTPPHPVSKNLPHWREFTNQSQWRIYITRLLKNNPKALLRALLIIDNYQEPDEKALAETVHHNGVGWGSIDAEFMQRCAALVRHKGPEYLTDGEWFTLRNKMPKYWRQLMNYSKRRLASGQESKGGVPGGTLNRTVVFPVQRPTTERGGEKIEL